MTNSREKMALHVASNHLENKHTKIDKLNLTIMDGVNGRISENNKLLNINCQFTSCCPVYTGQKSSHQLFKKLNKI